MKDFVTILLCYAIFILYILFLFKSKFIRTIKEQLIKFKKNIKFLIILLFVVIVLLLVGFYVIIPIDNDGDFLSYSGAIIGGALTLIGVWWTIDTGRAEKKNELSQQYKPILQITYGINIKNHKHYFFHDEYTEGSVEEDDPMTACYSIPLIIKNVGRGEMYNIRFEYKCNNENIYISKKFVSNFLNQNEQITSEINIRIKYNEDEKPCQIDTTEFMLYIVFEDLMNKTIYNSIPFTIKYLVSNEDIEQECSIGNLTRDINYKS